MKQDAVPSFDFPAYLEAKFAIDSASLNAPLYAQFQDRLRRTVHLRVLDLGTGTGAMLRRILELDLPGPLELVGLDQEEQNLSVAVDRVVQVLQRRKFIIEEKQERSGTMCIYGKKRGSELRVVFQRGDLLDRHTTDKLEPFDCITAHAFMDLMPLEAAVAIIRKLLKPDGIFYPTLNYDGLTVLMPEYEKLDIEQRLLRIYNRSMEQRRNRGGKTGGAQSGRRLYRSLLEEGFTILGMGSSDWNVFPTGGVYSDDQKLFLSAIVSMIAREAGRFRTGSGEDNAAGSDTPLDSAAVADWYNDRLQAVQNHSLSLIVHQLDLLARPT